jgi:hypothetical protein
MWPDEDRKSRGNAALRLKIHSQNRMISDLIVRAVPALKSQA